MNFKQLDSYLRAKKAVSYDYPFDDKVRVYRIEGKIFALMSDEIPLRINLKCDPIYALELRSIYEGVIAGYHMNKKHWNTVILDGTIKVKELKEWIKNSYNLVVNGLSKSAKKKLTK